VDSTENHTHFVTLSGEIAAESAIERLIPARIPADERLNR
jgi:hypothetical protein